MPPHLFACPGKNRIEPLHLTLPTNATLALCRSPASRAGRAPARGALRPRGHHARASTTTVRTGTQTHCFRLPLTLHYLLAVAAAMGVPASVIFEGKFSSNSMSQLQLLNAYHTVHCDRGQQGAHGHLPRRLHGRQGGRRARAAHGAAVLDGRAAGALRGGRHRHRERAARGAALARLHGASRSRAPCNAAQAGRPGRHRHQAARGAEQRQAGRRRRALEGGADGQDHRRDRGGRSSRWPRPRPRPRRRCTTRPRRTSSRARPPAPGARVAAAAVAAAAVAARPRLPKSELNKNFATCVFVWVYTKNRSDARPSALGPLWC